MKRSFIGLALGALVAVGVVLSLPSCGHDQKLVSLRSSRRRLVLLFRVPAAGATGQYPRVWHLHPSSSDERRDQSGDLAVDDQVVSIQAGLVTTNGSCGSADVSATMPEGTGGASNIVVGYSFVTVENTADPNCPAVVQPVGNWW